MELAFTGGIGDFIAIDHLWSPNERRSLRRIYWAAKCRPALMPILKRLLTYQQVEHVILLDHAPHHFKDWDLVPEPLRGGYLQFFVRTQGHGSTFAEEQLADVVGLLAELPERFWVVQGSTPYNPAEHRAFRDLTPMCWQGLIRRLDASDSYGVVLNSEDAPSPPAHPRLIDLTGKTTLAESLELLKASEGYLGIDSCLSVMASKVFPADRLMVKTRNRWLIDRRQTYFSPLTDFTFLREGPNWMTFNIYNVCQKDKQAECYGIE